VPARWGGGERRILSIQSNGKGGQLQENAAIRKKHVCERVRGIDTIRTISPAYRAGARHELSWTSGCYRFLWICCQPVTMVYPQLQLGIVSTISTKHHAFSRRLLLNPSQPFRAEPVPVTVWESHGTQLFCITPKSGVPNPLTGSQPGTAFHWLPGNAEVQPQSWPLVISASASAPSR
jgi:hypothetical protein